MPISEDLKNQLNEPNYYTRLGLERTAEASEIKKAYKRIALIAHPDKNNNDDSSFKKLGEAYETLIDPQKRAEYDLNSTKSFEAKSSSMEETPSSSATTMITEDIDSLEKLNNFILKLENNIHKISVLETETQSKLLKKIASKKNSIYFTNARRFSALDTTIKNILASVQDDIRTFLAKNKIVLNNLSLLDMDISKTDPDVFFQKIISTSEEIKKQIINTLELIKSKTDKDTSRDFYNKCLNSDSKTFILDNLFVLSDHVQKITTELITSEKYQSSMIFQNTIKELYNNKDLSLIKKIKAIYDEIDNFPLIHQLDEQYNNAKKNEMYSSNLKETISHIYEQKIPRGEKIKKITELEKQYQNQYCEENNVQAIYNLIKNKFYAFPESDYKVLNSQNNDFFYRTYKQVEKLESFFKKIVNHYKGKSPYKESKEFISALLELNSEDKTITQKFDALSRLVGNFEDEYLRQKIAPLEDIYWEFFKENLERPTNLTMENFSEFYSQQTKTIIMQLKNFEQEVVKNSSFSKKNRQEVSSFSKSLGQIKNDISAVNLNLLIQMYIPLKQKFDSHIKMEKTDQYAKKPSSPTPSTSANINININSNLNNPDLGTSQLNQQKNKQSELIEKKLSKYIKRIAANKNPAGNPDYAYGFWFFKKSRAINRKINYLLAGKLLELLNRNPGNFSMFEEIMKYRLDCGRELTPEELNHYADRGINSTELNEIINTAKSFNK